MQQPGPDEVLVNIKFSGVCHTDLHAINGDWPLATKLPLVGGHEGAGVVVARGDLVTDVEIGDHAGVKVFDLKANRTCHLLTYLFCSGSMAPAFRVTFVNKVMNLSAPKLSFLDIPSMEHFNNIVSPRPRTLQKFPKNSLLMPSLLFFAPVSPSTKVSKSREPVLARL